MGRKAKLKQQRREERLKTRVDFLVDARSLRSLRAAIRASGARADSCIFSTRVLQKVCRQLDVPFRPLSAVALVYNPIFGNYMREHDSYDLSQIPEAKVNELGEAGGRFVFVGVHDEEREGPLEPGKWAGHLVGVVGKPGYQFVVDLSIDQAHRPAKNIYINQPVAFPAQDWFLQGRDTAIGSAQHGLLFCYEAKVGDKSYETAPDWTREPDLDMGLSKKEIEQNAEEILRSLAAQADRSPDR